MQVLGFFLIIVAVVANFKPIAGRPKGEILMPLDPQGITRNRMVVKPFSDIKMENIVKQQYDFSCGSAALGTLLTFYLGEDLSERQIIRGLLKYGDSEKIEERRAFSLLDMRKFVKILGYKGVGYKAGIDDLRGLKNPAIVPIKVHEYRHFVVLKGIYDNHIFFADPWLGHSSYTINQFEHMWYRNILFIVYPEGAPEYSYLRLKESDLRYIDADATHAILTEHSKVQAGPDEYFKIDDVPGEVQFYK